MTLFFSQTLTPSRSKLILMSKATILFYYNQTFAYMFKGTMKETKIKINGNYLKDSYFEIRRWRVKQITGLLQLLQQVKVISCND